MPAFLLSLYSTIVYAAFLATFLYAIGFVEGVVVPKTIDSGLAANPSLSILIDAALLGLFALQHTIMARPRFKRLLTRIIPAEAERSTFVLLASAALALVCWQWRPLPQLAWSVEDPSAAALVTAVSWCGWAMLLISTFLISHFELFGLEQGFARLLRRTPASTSFVTPFLYRWLRHPIYAGFILAFWAAPRMSLGHLAFAVLTTAYIFVGIWFEERDLTARFGERYRQYSRTVGMLLPRFRSGQPRTSPR
jgi:protein-S-isoprenylcysteine O-methyltransferase Ste14